MKARLPLLLITLFFCSADGLAQSDLTCPPGSFYSAQFQSCLPASEQASPLVQCPAGYIYNMEKQTCGKGGGDWNAPSSKPSPSCAPGTFYDTRLKKCVLNRY